jgi:hypothetical protein
MEISIKVIIMIIVLYFLYMILYMILNNKIVSKNVYEKQIKAILRGSSRFALASLQDKSPLIALLHANYATGYFWALKDAFTDQQISQTTGLNILEYQNKITDIQDSITKKILNLCSDFASELDLNLAKTAGEF